MKFPVALAVASLFLSAVTLADGKGKADTTWLDDAFHGAFRKYLRTIDQSERGEKQGTGRALDSDFEQATRRVAQARTPRAVYYLGRLLVDPKRFGIKKPLWEILVQALSDIGGDLAESYLADASKNENKEFAELAQKALKSVKKEPCKADWVALLKYPKGTELADIPMDEERVVAIRTLAMDNLRYGDEVVPIDSLVLAYFANQNSEEFRIQTLVTLSAFTKDPRAAVFVARVGRLTNNSREKEVAIKVFSILRPGEKIDGAIAAESARWIELAEEIAKEEIVAKNPRVLPTPPPTSAPILPPSTPTPTPPPFATTPPPMAPPAPGVPTPPVTGQALPKGLTPLAVTEVPTDEDGKVFYSFEEVLYKSKKDLQKPVLDYLKAELVKKFPQSIPAKTEIVSFNGDQKICESGTLLDGRCFTLESRLMRHMASKLALDISILEPLTDAPVVEKPKPIPPPVLKPSNARQEATPPKLPKESSGKYEAFSPVDRKVGTFGDKQGGYLDLGHYTTANNRGPATLISVIPQSKPTWKSLGKKIEVHLSQSILPDPNRLPTMDTFYPDPESVKIEKGEVSFVLRETLPMELDAVAIDQAKSETEYLFHSAPNLSVLPANIQAELRKAWESGSTLLEKVEKVQSFFTLKIKYLLDDGPLYESYFKEHPEDDLVVALVKLLQGRCMPKNYTLGWALYRLSGNTLPIRFAKTLWLSPSEENPKPINTKSMHLHTEYLVVTNNHGRWMTAESSYTSSEGEKLVEFEKLNDQIRNTVERELGGKKRLEIPLAVTSRFRVEEHRTTGVPKLQSVNKSKDPVGPDEPFTLVLEEKNGSLLVSGLDDQAQPLEGFKLFDVESNPALLGLFLGIDFKGCRPPGVGRKWMAGEKSHQYIDIREYEIYPAAGTPFRIRDTYLLDFATKAVLVTLQREIQFDPQTGYELWRTFKVQ